MGKKRIIRKPVDLGHKTGTKKSDRHWTDPDGNKWDSRYEYTVYREFAKSHEVRRTTKSDTFSFTLPIKRGKCASCGSTEVGQQRTYTPDLHVISINDEYKAEHYYTEIKGFLRPKERTLFACFHKENPDALVRVLFQRNFPVGVASKRTGKRGSLADWLNKKCQGLTYAFWTGSVPHDNEWITIPLTAKKPKRSGKDSSSSAAQKTQSAQANISISNIGV
jgi:hypothetical protein